MKSPIYRKKSKESSIACASPLLCKDSPVPITPIICLSADQETHETSNPEPTKGHSNLTFLPASPISRGVLPGQGKVGILKDAPKSRNNTAQGVTDIFLWFKEPRVFWQSSNCLRRYP